MQGSLPQMSSMFFVQNLQKLDAISIEQMVNSFPASISVYSKSVLKAVRSTELVQKAVIGFISECTGQEQKLRESDWHKRAFILISEWLFSIFYYFSQAVNLRKILCHVFFLCCGSKRGAVSRQGIIAVRRKDCCLIRDNGMKNTIKPTTAPSFISDVELY